MPDRHQTIRFLLDQNVDENLCLILQGLGHEATHVSTLGLAQASDFELLEVAERYDVFITLDLHRQEAEFIAVNEAMIDRGVKILRIRLPNQEGDLRLDLARSIVYRMDQWLTSLMEPENALATIRSLGSVDSVRTRAEALAILSERRQE